MPIHERWTGGTGRGPTIRTIDILVVCTGNQCRSPMGEAVLRDRLARRGVAATVHSAGLMRDGAPAEANSSRAMQKRGFDLSAHRSTRITPEAVAGADLVVAMAREHLREAAVMVDGAFARTFTLRELVRRAEMVGPRRPAGAGAPADADGLQPFSDWLAKLNLERRPSDLIGTDETDDVPDPIGLSRRQHEKVADEVIGLVDGFVELAFPVGPPARP